MVLGIWGVQKYYSTNIFIICYHYQVLPVYKHMCHQKVFLMTCWVYSTVKTSSRILMVTNITVNAMIIQLPVHTIYQFSSAAQSCLSLCDPMDCSTPGLPVHHQLSELTQTCVHQVGDAIQPSDPLSSPAPAFNLCQQQDLFKWVHSLHQVAKVLEF